MQETHENQGGVEILVMLLHVFSVVLRRLSLVHVVENRAWAVALDRLEVHAQGPFDTFQSQVGDYS